VYIDLAAGLFTVHVTNYFFYTQVPGIQTKSKNNFENVAKSKGFLLHPPGNMPSYLMPIQKRSFCPISALCSKFYPRNINDMPVVKFFAGLDLEQKSSFLDGHYLGHPPNANYFLSSDFGGLP